MALIHIGLSTQQRMLEDFTAECGELKTIIQRTRVGQHEHEMAIRRLAAVESSVEELKKQMIDPSRRAGQYEGGYGNEEVTRFQQFKQSGGI